MADKYITTQTGMKRMKQTTVGWSVLVKWGDGSQQWIDLKVLKESNPVQVGEYVIACGIQNEPAFACIYDKILHSSNDSQIQH